jgi:hypothetical protein
MTQAEDLLVNVGLNGKFLREFAPQRHFQIFAVANFPARKFPLKAIALRAMPLADQDSVANDYDAGGYQDGFRLKHGCVDIVLELGVN